MRGDVTDIRSAVAAGDRIRRRAHVENFPATSAWLASQIEETRLVGAQIFVWQRGEILADIGVGLARRGRPMTRDSSSYWFCCSKPLMAIAVAQLAEQGMVRLDERVCTVIPAFASGRKDGITIRHLLTHTAGLRSLKHPRPFLASDEEIVEAVCRSIIRTNWTPGERAAYVSFESWYILGELVKRLTGMSIASYVTRHIFAPLDLDRCWLGLPPDAALAERSNLSIPHMITPGCVPSPMHFLSSPGVLQLVNAASGAIGPIRGLGLIFRSLLHPQPDAGLLSPRAVRELVSPQRTGLLDETYRLRWDWGLGFAVDLAPLCPAAAVADGFGHHGGPALVIADRAADRVVAVAVNGLNVWSGPPEVGASSAPAVLVGEIYRDLGSQ
jgi:CubicO group peptidase (beta-lactamase class C family)